MVLAVSGAVTWATRLPWLSPARRPPWCSCSRPRCAPQASPRNAVVGHLVGIGVGYCMLLVFGLTDVGPATVVGVGPGRVMAAALAVALTALLVNGIGLPNPPAASSTLVVALGVLRTPVALTVMAGACVLTVALCVAVNRMAGAAVPLWSPRTSRRLPR